MMSMSTLRNVSSLTSEEEAWSSPDNDGVVVSCPVGGGWWFLHDEPKQLEENDKDESPAFSKQLVVWILVVTMMLVVLLWMWWKRQVAWWQLSRGSCRLPTVVWYPRFFFFWRQQRRRRQQQQGPPKEKEKEKDDDNDNDDSLRLLPSSSITNILPRMQRLQGPYGMYGTLYGWCTKVVHMAHPVPMRRILLVHPEDAAFSHHHQKSKQQPQQQPQPQPQQRRWSQQVAYTVAATKNPAYAHFENFCGQGVFTARGNDWKAKRASVLHCCIPPNSTARLEELANQAANEFLQQVLVEDTAVTNVVPLLQRATLALIFQFLTHQNIHSVLQEEEEEEEGTRRTGEKRKKNEDHSSGDAAATRIGQRQGRSEQQQQPQQPQQQKEDDGATPPRTGKDNAKQGDDINNERIKAATIRRRRRRRQDAATAALDEYLQAVTKIRMIVLAQSRSIWFLLPRWMYRTFSRLYRQEEEALRPIRRLALLACRAASSSGSSAAPLARLAQQASHGGPTQNSTTQQMMDEAITLLFAGQDTSAATLSWTLHLLSLYPDVQQRLAEEILTVSSKDGGDCSRDNQDWISKHAVAQMPYLDAVIKESMRLYPVAPFVVRRLPHAVSIPSARKEASNTVVLPAGTVACLWIYSLHRNPSFWESPLLFCPQRWLNRHCDVEGKQEAFLPFCMGPRNCLGQSLAHVMLRIVLARIVRHYRLVDPRLNEKGEEDTPFLASHKNDRVLALRKEMQAGFTVLPKGGVHLKLLPRRGETSPPRQKE